MTDWSGSEAPSREDWPGGLVVERLNCNLSPRLNGVIYPYGQQLLGGLRRVPSLPDQDLRESALIQFAAPCV